MTPRSLSERLGYGPADRLLIVNCDDFGVSTDANAATARALRQGIATSASLMVPCPAAEQAAREGHVFPLGIHLTLTSEYPSYRWRGLTSGASLHTADGFLHATTARALSSLTAEDVRAEGQAQIEQALRWGVDATHLDCHMDVVFHRRDLFAVYLELAKAFGLPVRPRGAGDVEGVALRGLAARAGVLFPDHLIYPWPRPVLDVLLEQVATLPAGVTEIFAHPVDDGPALRQRNPAWADLRAADAAGLCDPALAAALDRHGIHRISYRDIRALQRL